MSKLGGGDAGHENARVFVGMEGYLQGSPSSWTA